MQYYNEACVEFSAHQYHKIFSSRFNDQETLYGSLKYSVEKWRNKTDNCNEWDNYM